MRRGAMKRYRVTFRFSDKPNASTVKTEEVEADVWRVDSDLVCLYKQEDEGEVKVFDVPTSRVMRIAELR
jgi:hypothetical protein